MLKDEEKTISQAARFRPSHDWVLIKRAAPEERSKGGIWIPIIASERREQGTVMAIGPGKLIKGVPTRITDINVGDTVIFNVPMRSEAALEASKVTIGDEEFLAVRETALLAQVVEDDA